MQTQTDNVMGHAWVYCMFMCVNAHVSCACVSLRECVWQPGACVHVLSLYYYVKF